MKYLLSLIMVFAILPCYGESANDLSNFEILKAADIATGDGYDGLKWSIDIKSVTSNGKEIEQTMTILATNDKWIAETIEPKKSKGQKLLKIGNNMWFSKKGLRKPVPISLRQRLTGGASNGDVASTRYAEDYEAVRVDDEFVNDAASYVFELTAKHNMVTYDKIKYWVNKQSLLSVKSEFYSKSNKLLKEATFKHNNVIKKDGEKRPFISEMIIIDMFDGSESRFKYYGISTQDVTENDFKL